MSVISKYRIVRLIGEGAMGQVFEAHNQALEQRVAIKVLRPEVANDPEAVARLFTEARAANIVDHPGIVKALELGHRDDGAAYLVMEYLDGQPLRALLHSDVVRQKAIRIGRQIASAMAAAHERGVVHRDLKPDNIFLVPDPDVPGGVRAKILDFGIAKLTSQQISEEQRYKTMAGAVLGTPVYMSPEQCRGASDIGAAADVYGLGCVLYHLLAGVPPFMASGGGEILAMHIYEEAKPLRAFDSTLPSDLSALVADMLRKNPAARPTMRQVASRLDALTAQLAPGGSELITTFGRGQRLVQERAASERNRRLSRLFLASVGLGIVGMGVWLRGSGTAHREAAQPVVAATTSAASSLDLSGPRDLGIELARDLSGDLASAAAPSPAAANPLVAEPVDPPSPPVKNRHLKIRKKDLTNEDIQFVPR